MGRQAKIRANRIFSNRTKKQVYQNLDTAGIVERVRQAYLALQRPEVQQRIREKATVDAIPWTSATPLDQIAAQSLREFGYDTSGIAVVAEYRDGEPPTVFFTADVSPEALTAAGGRPEDYFCH